MVSLKAPELKVGKFLDFLKSREFIVAAVAIVGTPLALRGLQSIVARSTFLQQQFTLAVMLAAFVLFLVAGMVSGFARAIFLGLAAGAAITAAAPFFEGTLNQVFGGRG